MSDPRTVLRDPVELSLPGHDRDCAIAMVNQARLRGGIDEIQVAHLLAIGHRAGVAAGRRQAADAIWRTHDAWTQLGKLPQSYLDGVADAASLIEDSAPAVVEAAPAEPVEESARRVQADVIRQAIAAIATLGPISGERWVAELERFAQIVEDEEGSDG